MLGVRRVRAFVAGARYSLGYYLWQRGWGGYRPVFEMVVSWLLVL